MATFPLPFIPSVTKRAVAASVPIGMVEKENMRRVISSRRKEPKSTLWKTARLPTDPICFIVAPTLSNSGWIREKWCAIARLKKLLRESPWVPL